MSLQTVGLILVPASVACLCSTASLDPVMARPPSTVSNEPAAAAITARTATVMGTLAMKDLGHGRMFGMLGMSWAHAGSCDIYLPIILRSMTWPSLIAGIVGMQSVVQVSWDRRCGIGLVRH